jgi:predicted nucleotidyltransferase
LEPIARPRCPTEASRALGFADRLAETCSQRLADVLTSVILHGSLTLGGYRSDRSDIDLLAIVARSLSDTELESLTRAVAAEQANGRRRVDLRVVTETIAASPVDAAPLELYVRLNPGEAPEVAARQPAEPDLLVELSVCREHGRTLRGASPRQAIGPVPHEWVVSAGDSQLARWESLTDDAPYAELMVLTACRIWRFAEERTHCSKSEAGLWTLARDPSLQAVHDALRLRAGDQVQVAPADIGRLLRIVRARIAASNDT